MWKRLPAGLLIVLLIFAPDCGKSSTVSAGDESADQDGDFFADEPVPPTGLPTAAPELLIGDNAHLVAVRQSLGRGEPQFKGALAALEADAKAALAVAPVSVVNKQVTPPSGDKHDYMSQAPYYWPDPSKPDGKPYIRRDGERNPEIEKITDRENLELLTRAVSSLALASYLTGRQDYAEHAAQLVRVWFIDPATRMNPNLNFGQLIPGIAEGRAAGVVETRFLPDILVAAVFLRGTPAWTASDERALKEWMSDYLTWLLESPFGREESSRGNNQETWTDLQIAALAVYTEHADIARQTLEAARADIDTEFEPDGSQPRELARTRAWSYSVFNLNAFMELAVLGQRVGVDLWNYSAPDGSSLRRGLDYLVPFATGEKSFPYRQLGGLHPADLHLILRRAAVAWNEPRYRQLAQEVGGAAPEVDLILP